MPQDYGFDAQEGVWRTSDMEVEIRSGCGVRMRIVGVDITPGRMVSGGDLCMRASGRALRLDRGGTQNRWTYFPSS